jgi:hypothetical protein
MKITKEVLNEFSRRRQLDEQISRELASDEEFKKLDKAEKLEAIQRLNELLSHHITLIEGD